MNPLDLVPYVLKVLTIVFPAQSLQAAKFAQTNTSQMIQASVRHVPQDVSFVPMKVLAPNVLQISL